MKARILSAVVGLPILGIVLFFNNTILLNIAVALISLIAVYELLHNTKYITDPGLLIVSMIYALLVPFSRIGELASYASLLILVYVVVLLSILFAKHKTLLFQQVAISFTSTVWVTYAMSSLVFVRELHPDDSRTGLGLYYIILIFICAWISDAGAYFIGRAFGKHKLASDISPKKTIEGAIGGVAFCVVFSIAFSYVYLDLLKEQGIDAQVNLPALIILSLIASLVGIMGDLAASIIKRQTGIKDFGHLMPGHGGVMDRFDSILFIAPFLYMVLQVFDVVKMNVVV